MTMKRNQPVHAPCSPSVSVSDTEVIALRTENDRLRRKNEELRKRNFKILDDVAGLEKQLQVKVSSPIESLEPRKHSSIHG
ncbi:unnamed protein product [Strongylus vulgaris]|uniref:Uncharacterized protein n=1 Tax=Strongylus vulgaris TaxID=40348 RepID=A0A3P7IP30_STRVU|nr:unnamed protein product [Strongylus vulgaris]